MGRPTKEAEALRSIAEEAATAGEYIDALLSWAEMEASIAAQSFDKPRQGRLARLSNSTARVLQAVSNIQRMAEKGG